jgi:hypothetical protein
MNENQKNILFTVAAIILGMLLYPPFQTIHPRFGGTLYGYDWILNSSTVSITVDTGLLLTQWVGVLLIGGLVYLALRNK